MENFKNINDDQISNEFMPSYEELATFLSSDVKNLVQTNSRNQNNNVRCRPRDVDKFYRIRVKLFGNVNCDDCFLNRLILDNIGLNYSYVDGSSSFDNAIFNPNFNNKGIFTEVHTNYEDKLLKILLSPNSSNSDNCRIFDSNCAEKCETGFRLSQIMQNIGDIEKLDKNCEGFNSNICIKQKRFILNRCGRCYVIFNFNLLNNGNNLAQKILFRDILPSNVLINSRSVFLDGEKISSNDIYLDKNYLVVKLNDLKPKENINITVVGLLFSFMRVDNFATISYVSSCFKHRNKTFVDIHQKTSNVKSL